MGFIAGLVTGEAASGGHHVLGGAARMTEYLGNNIIPNESIGMERYVQLYLLGLLQPHSFKGHMRNLGFDVHEQPRDKLRLIKTTESGILTLNREIWTGELNEIDRSIALMKNLPSPDEILVLLNRGLIDYNLARWLCHYNFGGEWSLATKWLELADQIPGPSDLIHFAIRDVWFPDIVQEFEYNKELPVKILPWMKKQGLGGKLGIPMPPGSTTTEGVDTRTEAQWFDAYWWSHWTLPAIGQANEMLQRLYPNSLYGPSPYADNTNYFSPEQLNLLYKANDIPPFWRARLRAISYTPLGRIDIRRMYASNILKEDDNNHEVFHAFKQQGYDDVNSKRLTQYVVENARRDIKDLTLKQVDKLYKQGGLAKENAIEFIQKLFFSRTEAEYHIANLDFELRSEEIDELLKHGKRAFLAGDMSLDNMRVYWNRMGLSAESQARYERIWVTELVTHQRHVSAQEAIRLFKNGIITQQALGTRLANLNYPVAERDIIVANAVYEALYARAKAEMAVAKQQAAALAKQVKQHTKDLEAIQKEKDKEAKAAIKEHESAIKADKGAFKEANIKAFWKAGVINEAAVRHILSAKGWLDNTINVWVETFNPDRPGAKSSGKKTKA